jgi:hypothetical protein
MPPFVLLLTHRLLPLRAFTPRFCSPGTVVTVINAIQSSEFLSPAQQEALVAALTKGGGAAAAAQRQRQVEDQLQQHQHQQQAAAAAAAKAGGE